MKLPSAFLLPFLGENVKVPGQPWQLGEPPFVFVHGCFSSVVVCLFVHNSLYSPSNCLSSFIGLSYGVVSSDGFSIWDFDYQWEKITYSFEIYNRYHCSGCRFHFCTYFALIVLYISFIIFFYRWFDGVGLESVWEWF